MTTFDTSVAMNTSLTILAAVHLNHNLISFLYRQLQKQFDLANFLRILRILSRILNCMFLRNGSDDYLIKLNFKMQILRRYRSKSVVTVDTIRIKPFSTYVIFLRMY